MAWRTDHDPTRGLLIGLALVLAVSGVPVALAASGYAYEPACGEADDQPRITAPGLLLIGGAEASSSGEIGATEWFLGHGGGGDYLVLRSDGIGTQADWICQTFPDLVSSSAELSIDTRSAADNTEVVEIISQAELIFIAGGDQTAYVELWRNTATAAALNNHLTSRPLAGTSAGMMILGDSYYAPAVAGVLSSEILDDPFNELTSEIGHADFVRHPLLAGVINDTHLDRGHGLDFERRYGRLFGLLARSVDVHPERERSYAIGADEGALIAIDPGGMARVFGAGGVDGPSAWFAQQHANGPEQISPGQPLVWDRQGQAVKVYRIVGEPAGHGLFNLNNWFNASGGQWLDWFTDNGAQGFNFSDGTCDDCAAADPPDREHLFSDRFL